MKSISYARHRFPRAAIQHALWLYLRFTLSCRDMAERGLAISYNTVRRWIMKVARSLRRPRMRPRPTDCWHMDKTVVTVVGKRLWLWLAVNEEGECTTCC